MLSHAGKIAEFRKIPYFEMFKKWQLLLRSYWQLSSSEESEEEEELEELELDDGGFTIFEARL